MINTRKVKKVKVIQIINFVASRNYTIRNEKVIEKQL